MEKEISNIISKHLFRNNDIGDKGMAYLCDALLDNEGVNNLIVWNNHITRESSPGIARLLVKP